MQPFLEPPLNLEALQGLFPKLEILAFIGSGGLGGVYRARQTQLEREIALKLIKIGDDPERHERFLREGKAMARLNHSHIVQVYDSGVTEGFGFLLMEYVDGQSLQSILREEILTPEEAEAYVLQLCDALHYAHQRGITHRDIKPGNILIGADGNAKLADFGLAKALEPNLAGFQLTHSNEQLGTPYYMAPEQRLPNQPADHRADLYALGVVYYEMLTNRLPIGRVEKPSAHGDLDPRLDELVLGAMDNNPDRRPKSAQDFKERLESIASTPLPNATRSDQTAIPSPAERSQPRKRMRLLALAGLSGLFLGGLVWLATPKRYAAEARLQIVSHEIPSHLPLDAHLEQTAESLNLTKKWNVSISEAKSRLATYSEILPIRDTDTLRVHYQSRDANEAVLIANQLAEAVAESEVAYFRSRVFLQMNREQHDRKVFGMKPLADFPTVNFELLHNALFSKEVLGATVDACGLEGLGVDRETALEALQERLSIDEARHHDLILIECRHTSAQRSADLANEVAKQLKRVLEIDASAQAKRALSQLESDVAAMEALVEEKRLAMEREDSSETREAYTSAQDQLTQMREECRTAKIAAAIPKTPLTVHEDAEVPRHKGKPLEITTLAQRPFIESRTTPAPFLGGGAGLGLLLGFLLRWRRHASS